jgi:hypothetical protein
MERDLFSIQLAVEHATRELAAAANAITRCDDETRLREYAAP